MSFSRDLIHDHFDKLYLAAIFALCLAAIGIAYWLIPEQAEAIVDYVKNSFVLGAIVGLVTGINMRNGNGNGHKPKEG
jgi:hypothetical protein